MPGLDFAKGLDDNLPGGPLRYDSNGLSRRGVFLAVFLVFLSALEPWFASWSGRGFISSFDRRQPRFFQLANSL
jgi:hypothetical protein